MNPYAQHPTSLMEMFRGLWHNWQLIAQMTRREVVGRYRGSVMGLTWSFLNPILMLEVQSAAYLSEDDIVHFEDIYQPHKNS